MPADKHAEQTWHFRTRSYLYVDLNTFEPGDFLSFYRSQTATRAGVRWLKCANLALEFTVWDIPGEQEAPSGLLVARLSLCSSLWVMFPQVVTSEWWGGRAVITGPPALHSSTLYAVLHRFVSSAFSPKRFASALGSGLSVCGCSPPPPRAPCEPSSVFTASTVGCLIGEEPLRCRPVSHSVRWFGSDAAEWLIDFCRHLKPIHGIF